jgi:hypothetical protein
MFYSAWGTIENNNSSLIEPFVTDTTTQPPTIQLLDGVNLGGINTAQAGQGAGINAAQPGQGAGINTAQPPTIQLLDGVNLGGINAAQPGQGAGTTTQPPTIQLLDGVNLGGINAAQPGQGAGINAAQAGQGTQGVQQMTGSPANPCDNMLNRNPILDDYFFKTARSSFMNCLASNKNGLNYIKEEINKMSTLPITVTDDILRRYVNVNDLSSLKKKFIICHAKATELESWIKTNAIPIGRETEFNGIINSLKNNLRPVYFDLLKNGFVVSKLIEATSKLTTEPRSFQRDRTLSRIREDVNETIRELDRNNMELNRVFVSFQGGMRSIRITINWSDETRRLMV